MRPARQGLDPATYMREGDRAPERLGSGTWDPTWSPSDTAERLVWANIPADGSARLHEVVVDVPGLTGQQARMALLALVMGRKARAWQEAPGIHLVARGPFRQCDRCGAQCAPGPCWACGHDPATAMRQAA